MLTRFIKIQLIIFAVVSVVGLAVMLLTYIQVPTLLGVGRITVKVQMPASGGLYRFSNVTYRGVEVGKVTEVGLLPNGAQATLSLRTDPKIPADLQAEVRSISAIGEQYIDLRPRTDSAPYLQNGSVVPMNDTVMPTAIGPTLDKVSSLIGSIPKDKLSQLLDETYNGFNGAGYDFGSLIDSGSKLTGDLNPVAERARTLVDDTEPFLDSQAQTADSIRTFARSLAGVTDQVRSNDPDIRALLKDGPGAAQEASRLLNDLKPTLPVLLANLTSLGQVLVTYNKSLEQLLVLLPPYFAQQQSYSPVADGTGKARGTFALEIADPGPCTVGFLPPSAFRSPADTSDIDTPDGLYCKLPQDSPIGVRGARNYPCIEHPGKRAPTVEICDSDKPYEPLAMRQHVLGPSPFDPNLVSQGVPLDDRVSSGDNLYVSPQGTPLPPGAVPAGTPPEGAPAPPAPLNNSPASPPPPSDVPPPPPAAVPADGVPPTDAAPVPAADGVPAAAPSSFTGKRSGPTAAVAEYNPRTGEYVGKDGNLYRQLNLVGGGGPKSWQDLMPK